MKFYFHTHTHTHRSPHPNGSITLVALWQNMCFCMRFNNLTKAMPPLLVCLIPPVHSVCCVNGKQRDRIKSKGLMMLMRAGQENWGERSTVRGRQGVMHWCNIKDYWNEPRILSSPFTLVINWIQTCWCMRTSIYGLCLFGRAFHCPSFFLNLKIYFCLLILRRG